MRPIRFQRYAFELEKNVYYRRYRPWRARRRRSTKPVSFWAYVTLTQGLSLKDYWDGGQTATNSPPNPKKIPCAAKNNPFQCIFPKILGEGITSSNPLFALGLPVMTRTMEYHARNIPLVKDDLNYSTGSKSEMI